MIQACMKTTCLRLRASFEEKIKVKQRKVMPIDLSRLMLDFMLLVSGVKKCDGT